MNALDYTVTDVVEAAQERLAGCVLCLDALRGLDRVETRFTRCELREFVDKIESDTMRKVRAA